MSWRLRKSKTEVSGEGLMDFFTDYLKMLFLWMLAFIWFEIAIMNEYTDWASDWVPHWCSAWLSEWMGSDLTTDWVHIHIYINYNGNIDCFQPFRRRSGSRNSPATARKEPSQPKCREGSERAKQKSTVRDRWISSQITLKCYFYER